MNPRLIAISGKIKGTIFALKGEEVSIGRESTNSICLNDRSVSRQHCLIKREKNNCFFIQDLESFNGIFVSGIPVNHAEIKHGDQLGIGDVILFFLLQETEAEAVFQDSFTLIQDDAVDNRSTIKLLRKDAIYLSPESLLIDLSQTVRVAEGLSVMLQITSVLNSIRELDSLQESLLELTMKAIPAERGVILLVGEDEQKINSHHVWGPKNSVHTQVSKTAIGLCLKERVSILSNNLSQDEIFHLSESLAAAKVNSILCAPLMVFERIIGLLYLETSQTDVVFDRDHLQLLTGIGEIAARPLEDAIRIKNLKLENERLLAQLDGNHKIVGESNKIKKIFDLIARIAPTESTILILGESGTGKELAARAIHQNSNRSDKPFVAVNCAALTDNLLESELFGHERGAFTGAINDKKGQFEVADGGTIFLDEVGELAFNLQAKLLRVIQERELVKLGGIKAKKLDVRIIAATNRDLSEDIKNGRFRGDLYFRLNVINLTMPALRERPEDIILLARFFIAKYNKRCKRNINGISPEAKSRLQSYEWVGNIRELENTIERAVILAQQDVITVDDLPDSMVKLTRDSIDRTNSGGGSSSYRSTVLEAKKKIVKDALLTANGNIPEAAKYLDVHPNNLHRLIKEFGLRNSE
jgi:Nif-specific regulatory protein